MVHVFLQLLVCLSKTAQCGKQDLAVCWLWLAGDPFQDVIPPLLAWLWCWVRVWGEWGLWVPHPIVSGLSGWEDRAEH